MVQFEAMRAGLANHKQKGEGKEISKISYVVIGRTAVVCRMELNEGGKSMG